MVSAPTPTIDPTEPVGFLRRRSSTASSRRSRRRPTVIGPTIADGAVVYDEITSQADLPAGWRRRPGPGPIPARPSRRGPPVRLRGRPDRLEAVHLPAPGPLTIGRRDGGAVTFTAAERPTTPLAFLGVRACELAALGIQDRPPGGPAVDADYAPGGPRCSSSPSSA